MKQILSIPVIIIPNIVFFPGTSLPLFVIEKKYHAMIEKSLVDAVPIAIALANENVPSEIIGNSPHRICGIGVPVFSEFLEDGTLKVLMKNVGTARLIQQEINFNYPIYISEVKFTSELSFKIRELDKLHYLENSLFNWLEKNINSSQERDQFKKTINSNESIIYYLCSFLISDSNVRQMILEIEDINDAINLIYLLIEGNDIPQENIFVTEAIRNFQDLEYLDKIAN